MPWIPLTAADVKLAEAEADVIRSLASEDGGDPILSALDSAINEVRGYIAARYPLGLAGTLPDTLKDTALALARYKLLNLPGLGLPITEDRRNEYKDAIRRCESVARGEFAIETPAELDTAAQQSITPRPSFGSKTLVQSRDEQDGL